MCNTWSEILSSISRQGRNGQFIVLYKRSGGLGLWNSLLLYASFCCCHSCSMSPDGLLTSQMQAKICFKFFKRSQIITENKTTTNFSHEFCVTISELEVSNSKSLLATKCIRCQRLAFLFFFKSLLFLQFRWIRHKNAVSNTRSEVFVIPLERIKLEWKFVSLTAKRKKSPYYFSLQRCLCENRVQSDVIRSKKFSAIIRLNEIWQFFVWSIRFSAMFQYSFFFEEIARRALVAPW